MNAVRVRFAPSPTGPIHLGGLRTALYNYLFAKQNSGKFILRIEDTDQSRVQKDSALEIENVLVWAGLKPDESPLRGGPHNPYTQSQRLESYKESAHNLIESGHAYKCFCSRERLELLRIHQTKNRLKPGYDSRCKHLSKSEIDDLLTRNRGKYTIRFKMRPGPVKFDDLILSQLKFPCKEDDERDFVILKEDQFPTYHLANVVDDHYMAISHVLRGQEWLSSTPKHIQMYEAFGWNAPIFAHFPLITLKSGTKISKRHAQGQMKTWIEAGYSPQAIINFLLSMGGGLPHQDQNDLTVRDMDYLIETFDFSRVSTHPSSVDLDRLKILNSNHLEDIWRSEPKKLMKELQDFLSSQDLVADNLESLLEQSIGRISTFQDLLKGENSFIWGAPTVNKFGDEERELLRVIGGDIKLMVESINISDRNQISEGMKSLALKHNQDWKYLMRFLRKILTGDQTGLPVHEIFTILGKDRLVERLNKIILP